MKHLRKNDDLGLLGVQNTTKHIMIDANKRKRNEDRLERRTESREMEQKACRPDENSKTSFRDPVEQEKSCK